MNDSSQSNLLSVAEDGGDVIMSCEVTRHHLNALSNASNCARGDLSCGVMAGILRSIPSNS